MNDLSVGTSVGLSSALWKNSGSDPDAVWHRRSDGSMDEAVSEGLGIGPRERIHLEANLGRAIVTNGDFIRRWCAPVPQPSELRFGVVRAVGRGVAVLDGSPRRAGGRGGFGGFRSPISQWEMTLGRRR